MMKKFAIITGVLLTIGYFLYAGYVITKGIESIKQSSYNIGCMSLPGLTYQQIEQCKALYKHERVATPRSRTTT